MVAPDASMAQLVEGVLAFALGNVDIVAALTLVVLLLARELSSIMVAAGTAKRGVVAFNRYIIVPILPLLVVFAVMVAIKAREIAGF